MANTSPFDLADDHVDDDEGSSASDTGTAVHDDRSRVCNGALPTVDVVEEVQNASGIGRYAVVGPSLLVRGGGRRSELMLKLATVQSVITKLTWK